MRSSFLLLAGLAACATTDPDPQWLQRPPVAVDASASRDAAFDVPAALQLGFDAPVADGKLAVGDRLLLGVRMDRDDDVQVRYVRAEVVGIETEEQVIPPHTFINDRDEPMTVRSRHALVHAVVHDVDCTVLGEDTVKLDPDELERGLAFACRGDALPADYGPFRSPDAEAAMRASIAIQSLRNVLRVARISPPLRALLWQVVDVPSIFSLIRHFGVRISVAANFQNSVPAAPFAVGAAEVATWLAAIELQLNGSPALRCRVHCADPASPLALAAGIVELTAASPSHPQRRVTMRLLGARRGGGS